MPVVLENLGKRFGDGAPVLDGVNASIGQGEFVALLGASGCGKSTLLNIIAGLEAPTSGALEVPSDGAAFMFQDAALFPWLTARENVELASQISKDPLDIDEVMASVGLADRMPNFPSQLSGGEQQRVAIARAVAKNPKLLLCDEPTGALDYETGRSILRLLQETCRNRNITVVVITHNPALMPMGNRVIKVKSGLIGEVMDNAETVSVDSLEW